MPPFSAERRAPIPMPRASSTPPRRPPLRAPLALPFCPITLCDAVPPHPRQPPLPSVAPSASHPSSPGAGAAAPPRRAFFPPPRPAPPASTRARTHDATTGGRAGQPTTGAGLPRVHPTPSPRPPSTPPPLASPPPLGVVDAPVGVAASQCLVPLFFFFSLCSLFPRAVFRVAPPPALSPVPLRPCGSLTSLPVRRPLPAAAGGSGTHPVLSPSASRRPCVVAFAFPPSPCPTSRSLVARTFVPSRLLPCRYPLSYEPPPAPCPRTHPLSISTSETPPAPPPRSPPLPGPCLPSP